MHAQSRYATAIGVGCTHKETSIPSGVLETLDNDATAEPIEAQRQDDANVMQRLLFGVGLVSKRMLALGRQDGTGGP